MRRLLILMLLLLLTACSAAPAEKTEPPPVAPPAEESAPVEETVPEEEVLPPEEPVLRFAVEPLVLQGQEQAEDGTVLLTYDMEIPRLTVLREDGTAVSEALTAAEEKALAAAAAFNERFRDWTAEEYYIEMAETARQDLDWIREAELNWYGGYSCALNCAVYQTERFISISATYSSYTGGAHPNTSWLGWNFDLKEGAFLDAERLSENGELREAVAAEILRQATTPWEDGTIPAEGYWPDYETLVADWDARAVSFDAEGMTVVFSPYDLAPYAYGPQEFHFAYDWLKPHLSPYGRILLGPEES